MSRVLIIGAGAAGSVVAQKCAKLSTIFTDIHLASRRIVSCEKVRDLCKSPITIHQVDANIVPDVVALLKKVQPKLVINMALPYQDLPIMDACLEAGVHYMDTANYEPPEEAKFSYTWQWAYQDKFKAKGLMALLGSGFDPGVTNVYCAYAQKHYFDEIHYVDIVDCNAGSHGHPFATNFNPEINIREITQNGKYWEAGEWKEIPPMSVSEVFDFPGVGDKKAFLLYHEEEESLVKHLKGLKRIRFWMTFGEEYLTHLRVLQNVNMTSIKPVMYNGMEIVPLQFLKAVLPDPSSLGVNYTGKTSIGCIMEGIKDGKPKKIFIYNICDHAECYREFSSQAVSTTTGIPAVIGAAMILQEKWIGAGVFNMEQMDPDPFMAMINVEGLPWHVMEM